ncbi:SpoIIE family protein phosphatase [Pseudonocardia sp. 73-21]|uniref:SpoIIE family protein phosphatase n=1 Tax=Pseudonocardia sp. 73-21 TaxID=1895809 RepID=UPI0026390D56|nr:SpoIIE family protein phosphatase [Pseudonocardia sp. 73-21]
MRRRSGDSETTGDAALMSVVIRDAVEGNEGRDPLFAGAGELGEVMAARDWTTTSVGPPDTWPPELRSVVRILLTSKFSMWMAWGPDLTFFYNDAYRRDTLRQKHPWAFGRPADEVWAEVWEDIGPRIRSVLETGEATWDESLQLFVERSGYLEESYHTFSYSPLADAGGTISGLLCVVTETTERVLSERRLRILGELGDISAVTAPTVDEAARAALAVMERAEFDLPFASIYLTDPDGQTARRAGFYGMVDDARVVPVQIDQSVDRHAWSVLSDGRAQVLTGTDSPCCGLFTPTGSGSGAHGTTLPTTVVAVPLAGGGGGEAAGVLFAGVSPFRALDTEYRRFIDLAARQVATAIADAAAFQAQRRRADELAELDRAKTEFFTGVSHELRTPLSLITAPATDSLADRAHPLPAVQRERIELIARNGGRLRKLVDTILDFARLEGGQLTPDRVPVDLAELTRGIAESFTPAVVRAGLGYALDCPPLPSAVSVDVAMWEKIVLNLLSNAVKYTLSGQITLDLRLEDPPSGGDDPQIRLSVTDTGVGIPDEDQPLLFRRFHRVRGAAGRSDEGSGIGLALVSELTALHDGTVGVRSVLGRGSTFTVTLPGSSLTGRPTEGVRASTAVALYREEALQWSGSDADPPSGSVSEGHGAGAGAGSLVDAGSTAGATVLIAEDNPDLRRFLAALLAGQYTVVLATDGVAALSRARELVPDLVLTDVMMPRLDGFGLLAALRNDPATATIPVIMLSAQAGEEASADGLAAGADDYVVKPFSSHDLVARVRSNLQLARLRNEEATWRAAMIDALQDCFYILDAESGAIVEINAAMTELLGLEVRDLPCGPPYPFFPTADEDPGDLEILEGAFAAAMASGSGQVVIPLRHIGTRARVWASVTYSSLRDRAGRRVFISTMRDVTAQRRAAHRDAVLADTGRLLAGSGPLRHRLTQFAQLAVREVADLALISVVGPDGRLAPYAAAHRTSPGVADDVLGMRPFRIPDQLADAYHAGRAFTLDDVDDDLLDDFGTGARDIVARHAVTVRNIVVAPLAVAGRLLGSLSLTAMSGGHDAARETVVLAEELGRRVAGAIEADRVAAREQRLQQVTAELASAATLEQAAVALTDGILGILGAAAAAVFTVDADRSHIRTVYSAGFPPGMTRPSSVVRTSTSLPATDAARTGRAVWLGDQAAWSAHYPDSATITTVTGGEAVTALPLISGGRVIGVVAATFQTSRTFLPDEREFASTIAGQAAQAFERAVLADQRWHLAQTLQNALLPPALPDVPQLALAARYAPAVADTSAGGDWFDVFGLDDTHVALSVGDVVGQGPAAAAVMGQLRGVLSSALLQGRTPPEALEILDQFAGRVPGARGSTALCATLDIRTGELHWSAAGHPPLMLIGPGDTRYLDGGEGTLLGITGRPAYVGGRDVMTPGASVLLYTDGLVERRGEVLDEGLERIATIAAPLDHLPPDALAEALLQEALAGSDHADDIAIVIARLIPAPLRGRLTARPTCLPGMRRGVATWARLAGLPEAVTEDLQLVVSEAASNSIEHAYRDTEPGEFTYEVGRGPGGTVHVEVEDFGRWRPPPADPGYRGRGLAVIHTLAREVTLDVSPHGTRIRFDIPATPAAVLGPDSHRRWP